MTLNQKLFISMRYFLMGRKHTNALKALEYASHFHTGLRKDKVTPEFQHQLEIGHYLRTFEPSLSFPEETLTTIFLHDVCEDADIGFVEIDSRFGSVVGKAVRLLTKTHRGQKKDIASYFDELAENPISSVVKGGDRIHNIQSMVGVFSVDKQRSYIEETETYIIPALKKARRLFPEQENVYENVKYMLRSQISLIKRVSESIK